jgi:acyl transferase domain-containing protein/3-hydroxymyristoyl/3-hydroxydecanoyl-(acyl carrier protein) dehydratase
MSFEPIAIVGRSCILPGALSPSELWLAVAGGCDLIGHAPTGYWRVDPELVKTDAKERADDCSWSDRGGYVNGFSDIFDPAGYLLPAEQLETLDPLFHWVLHGTRQALRDCSYDVGVAPLARTGLIVGNLSYPSQSLSQFAESVWLSSQSHFLGGKSQSLLGIERPDPRNRFMSGLPARLAAKALGLGGSAYCLDAACSSSLYAIKLACDRLQRREDDLLVAGGVNRADDLFIHVGFCALQAMSATGQSRPFHRNADGLVPAEGAAFVALKRLADAEAAGDKIWGVIRGIGLSNDGRAGGLLAPSEEGQVRALSRAYELSGIAPRDISFVECHATGTPVGDGIEIRSMRRIFGRDGGREGDEGLPIGSLKSNLGHLITASGAAALIKVIEAMSAETLPPTLHADPPLDELGQSGFRTLATAQPWQSKGLRRAGINNFGFGGNNAHLIVEEWREPLKSSSASVARSRPSESKAPVAVIGLEVLAADGEGVADFGRDLFSGHSRIRAQGEQGPGAFAEDVTLPLQGIRFPPNDLDQTLAQQLMVLGAAWRLLERLGEIPSEKTGALIGMQCDAEVARYGARWRLADWAKRWQEAGSDPLDHDWVERTKAEIGALRRAAGVVGAMPNIPANRLCSQFDLAGPSFTVSAEEHSGLVSLKLAIDALRADELELALVGAVDICCEPVHRAANAVLAEDKRVPGDAALVIALKRLDLARRDGDRVMAIVDETAAVDGTAAALRISSTKELNALFGHAHAASGLMQFAAAVLAVDHRATPVALLGNEGGALPWLGEAEQASVSLDCEAFGNDDRMAWRVEADAETTASPLSMEDFSTPLIFRAKSRSKLVELLKLGIPGGTGGHALAVTGKTAGEQNGKLALAIEMLSGAVEAEDEGLAVTLAPGIYYRSRPLEGELAFVFTGPAGSYPGMGSELVLAFPQQVDKLRRQSVRLQQAAGWIYDPENCDPKNMGDESRVVAEDKLWGSAFLSYLHYGVCRDVLGLRPEATIGFCSGETNALFATGAWRDIDEMHQDLIDTGVFSTELGGTFNTIATSWRKAGLINTPKVNWQNWRLLYDRQEVEAAIAEEEMVRLTIVNAPGDVVIGGEAVACQRVVEKLGKSRAYRLHYDVAIHCGEVEPFRESWWKIHHRETTPVEGLRYYSVANLDHYQASADNAAKALTGMALNRVDFPSLIEKAYADGVRIFVELGPRDGCSKWIARTLDDAGGRSEYLSVAMDRGGRSSLQQLVDVVAQLAVAGVNVDLEALDAALAPLNTAVFEKDVAERRYPAHPGIVHFPQSATAPITEVGPELETMPAAPVLPSVLNRQIIASTMDVPGDVPAEVTAPSFPPMPLPQSASADKLSPWAKAALEQHQRIFGAHQQFLVEQEALHQRFLQGRNRTMAELRALAPSGPTPGAPASAMVQAPQVIQPVPEAKRPPEVESFASSGPRGPQFDRQQLEVLATGKISDVFGALFAKQDAYVRQVRLPEGPLLLVDRITGIDAEAGVLGKGTIWTETDIHWDAWYLNEGRMPAGIVVESGQADLTLASWMGIDFLNKGDRVYRLLGCDLSYHGTLPKPGDTLSYEIHIDSHAQVGDVRLFFFHYDCHVNGELRLKVRNGQAGFFTDQELADSQGILWAAETAEVQSDARLDAPKVECEHREFSAEQVKAFAEGDVLACFGKGFELAQTHTRTPKIQSGKMQLLQQVDDFDPQGGPWGRGYLKVTNDLSSDDWYLHGHFKNDECMPGTLMCEGCLQAMAFFITGMGYTLDRDGWRFDPVPDETYELRCRGQVTPQSKQLTYEVFVEEIIDGPMPTIYADILGSSDGLKIFHGRRMGLRLVPDWPLTDRPQLLARIDESNKAVAEIDGFRFGYASLLACAWGKPSDAFGELGRAFDGTRQIARLPGPPYHFMSRVTEIKGVMGSMKPGASIELEYDIPDDAWYFEQNGAAVMPFCVLLEAALQPCGWLAVFIGCPGTSEKDLCFRNLDGSGPISGELRRGDGILRTRTTIKSISSVKDMIIVSFEYICLCDEREIFRSDTSFGFFPPEALAEQVGMPATDEERAWLDVPNDFAVDLRARPSRYCEGILRLAGPMLLMLDRVTGYWPDGGPAGLGRLRAEKKVEYSEWFFKAHFFQDPVQPGSLGIEAMLQLLQFYMIHEEMGEGIENPRFEAIALDRPLTWKYRGQVTPQKKRISTELNILEKGRDERGAFVVAEAWLWVDGLRIYQATNMGMRIVAGTSGETGTKAETGPEIEAVEVLDPEVDEWLLDHCPNYTLPTLPLMSMVDRLAQAAVDGECDADPAQPRFVVDIQDVALEGWLSFAEPRRLRKRVVERIEQADGTVRSKVLLEVWRDSAREELSRYDVVASATVTLAAAYPDSPEAWHLEGPSRAEKDPYVSGALFHGPAFQLLRDLRISSNGSAAILDAAAPTVPFGLLNQGLLDGAVHGIPHDNLGRWAKRISKNISDEDLAYPYKLRRLQLFGPAPKEGAIRCEARVGAAVEGERFVGFEIQLIRDEVVWAEFDLVEVLVPMGDHGRSREKRLSFLKERFFVEGVGLSRFAEEAGQPTTRLSEMDYLAKDWLKGSVAHTYALSDDDSLADKTRKAVIKDHVAQIASVHPQEVVISNDGNGGDGVEEDDDAAVLSAPFTRFPVTVEKDGNDYVAKSSGKSALDLSLLEDYSEHHLAMDPWLGQRLTEAFCNQFVRQIRLTDSEAFYDLLDGPAIYLANHQVQIESMLFPTLISALGQRHVLTIAKAEHRAGWVGKLDDLSHRYPGADYPRGIVYFDQQDPASMLSILEGLKAQMLEDGHSLFVHVEGELGLSCRQNVERVSSVFLDLALSLRLPLIPVRFAGGLPVTPLLKTMDFPLDFGQQDYVVGRPIAPDELEALPYAERREFLLEAVNGLAPRDEEPLPGDGDFAARQAVWQNKCGDQARAVVLTLLDDLGELTSLLDTAKGDGASWAAEFVDWLLPNS